MPGRLADGVSGELVPSVVAPGLSSPERRGLRWSLVLCVLAAVVVGVLVAAYSAHRDHLVESAYHGQGTAWLNRVLYNPTAPPVEWYAQRADVLFSRLVTVCVAAALVPALWGFRRRAARRLTRFFQEEGDSLSLAVFRIVFFTVLLVYRIDVEEILFHASLPDVLRVRLQGMGQWFALLPFSPEAAQVAIGVMQLAGFTAAIGLFSRTSALCVCLASLYALGIAQCFGKVNHYHEVVWFSAILAASRCGDSLSVDAALRAWRRPGAIDPQLPGRVYALPLRFIWLLMGVIYFFPGLWKLLRAGRVGEWFYSDNLRNVMYQSWSASGMIGSVRIDHYPLLYKTLALAVIVVEMGFVVLVLFPRTRIVAAAAGLSLHTGSALIVGIAFVPLKWLYVMFVNWTSLLHGLGRWLAPAPAVMRYRADRLAAARLVALIKAFDVLGRVELRPEPGPELVEVSVGDATRRGAAAVRAALRRCPLLWPLLPLFYLPPLASAFEGGDAGGDAGRSSQAIGQQPPRLQPSLVLVGVGAFLLAINSWYGLRMYDKGWPFACYPTFASLAAPQIGNLEIESQREGKVGIVEGNRMGAISAARWTQMTRRMAYLPDPVEQRAQLTALWDSLVSAGLVAEADRVRFYRTTRSMVPEDAGQPPLERVLLLELRRQ